MGTENKSGGLEGSLESIFSKLPALPESARKSLADWMPWIIIIVAVISLPAILAIFSLGALLGPFAAWGGIHVGAQYYISWILFLVAFVMELMAVKGLISKSMSGWKMIFYATLVYALGQLIDVNIFSLIISTGISLYLLFQIKSYYK